MMPWPPAAISQRDVRSGVGETRKGDGPPFDPVLTEILVEVISKEANAASHKGRIQKTWYKEERLDYG